MKLILASQSPRRRELMEQMGLHFTVRVADIDETMDESLPLEQAVAELSCRKAVAVSAEEDEIVVAADTIVVLENAVLGKPRSHDEAKEMLRRLSGKTHKVMTGVTVRKGEETMRFTDVTEVRFRKLSETEISAYVSTNDPMDKAGSYGIQGFAGLFVEKLHGDYFNVMGLPICTLGVVLRRFGVEVLGEKG